MANCLLDRIGHGAATRRGVGQRKAKPTATSPADRFKSVVLASRPGSNAAQITGLICGYRVEQIENPLTQKARYLDKVVDELARGKKMQSILRS